MLQTLVKEYDFIQNSASPRECRELESKIETAFTGVLTALGEDPVSEFSNVMSFQYNFPLHTGMKEREDVPHLTGLYEQLKSNQFGIFLNGIKHGDNLTKNLDKIFNFIKNRRFPRDKLWNLHQVVNTLNINQINSNNAILRQMIEMGFKETEQSVLRSVQLSFLVNVIKKASMVESYSSRLKSLISSIISAMEADDKNEWDISAFFSLISAIKRTPFLDYFLPQLEQVFSNVLAEFEKNSWLLESEEIDISAIEGTKLSDQFKEWAQKTPPSW